MMSEEKGQTAADERQVTQITICYKQGMHKRICECTTCQTEECGLQQQKTTPGSTLVC